MRKVKTINKIIFVTLFIFLLCEKSMAGLIKPEPKPVEFQNIKENKKLSKPINKIEKNNNIKKK